MQSLNILMDLATLDSICVKAPLGGFDRCIILQTEVKVEQSVMYFTDQKGIPLSVITGANTPDMKDTIIR